MQKQALPVHVGLIMDGNGRWAKQRKLPRTSGHEEGLKRAKDIAKAAADLGLRYVTLYVFSTENWKRTEQEVGFLMNLIHTHLVKEFQFYRDNQIRVKLLGDITGLPKNIQDDIREAEADTENFTGLTLCLAINYGGRDEIVRGVKKLLAGHKDAGSLSEQDIQASFDIPELPDLDVLIRTGGEKRLSNFLLWQSAYAELIFSDTLWPDYSPAEFLSDIAEFKGRVRKFGAVPV
ncbi:MAG TPA: di-trans,poly-cis-decaprenylcistransferase [Treponema sp.]|nr:di-trans,poly-cis-decaprenylcistransferase [Treponema sp.]